MSSILNKSNHPVTVKKIKISVWTLRDEIEAAIKSKIDANGGDSSNIDISDIQEYYTKNHHEEIDEDDSDLDPSGNPMDEDAKAMMAALGGGGDTESSDEATDKANDNSDDSNEEESEEEKMASDMLEGQGVSTKEEASEETEAEKMAREMLEGQGAPEESSKESTTENNQNPAQASFQRVTPDKETHNKGFIFLSDINMEQALLFTRETYTTGSNVVIQFNIPKPFTLTAEVLSSFSINRNSRVISESKPNYRIQCGLKFTFPGERTLLREFLKSVEPDIPPPPNKLKKPAGAEDEEEDEFDDLGF